MKHLTISYRIYKTDETAEDAIMLPMLPEYAERIMSGQPVEHLDFLLDRLAQLQGYDTADVLSEYDHDGSVHDNGPLAGVETWNPADENWTPGGDAND